MAQKFRLPELILARIRTTDESLADNNDLSNKTNSASDKGVSVVAIDPNRWLDGDGDGKNGTRPEVFVFFAK